MFGNVLPGLRELRAPLAAGYLWLTLFWLIFGDRLPTKSEVKSGPLDRLYELEPVVSTIGKAVVVSVAAYIVGSVAIDAQSLLRRLKRSTRGRISSGALGVLESFLADAHEVQRAYLRYLEERVLNEQVWPWTGTTPDQRAHLLEFLLGQVRAEFIPSKSAEQNRWREEARLPRVAFDEGSLELSRVLRHRGMETFLLNSVEEWFGNTDIRAQGTLVVRRLEGSVSNFGGNFSNLQSIADPAVQWIDENRTVIKTRLLDLSQTLHSEVDRPDAEATFRMGLWPPLAAIVIYLAVAQSRWWLLGIVAPIVLAAQWLAYRRTANDALVTAIVAKPEALTILIAGAYRSREEEPAAERDAPPDTPAGPLEAPTWGDR